MEGERLIATLSPAQTVQAQTPVFVSPPCAGVYRRSPENTFGFPVRGGSLDVRRAAV